ncbi:bifunctional methionine sulfoxide reductase B/A protein [Planctomycetota bacterium]
MRLREYSIVSRWLPLAPLFVVVAIGGTIVQPYKPKSPLKTMLIDEFSSESSKKSFSTNLQFVSDRVMGGVSSGKIAFVNEDERSAMHLTGGVSLANNDGFIQVRKNFNPKGRSFDARRFTGIKLRAKGNSQQYAVHLKTSQSRLAWQYYQAVFSTNGQWQEIKIPFTLFKPYSLGSPLNTRTLKSIAIVAIGREFQTDILVDEIAFYGDKLMYKKLTPEEERIIINKGTERPFTGKYDKHFEEGVYTCKQCGEELFDSSSKFKSSCGWPSYDEQKGLAVTKQLDADGVRTEIICTNCGGHLGHVFTGEGYTPKNTRYCVNSVSVDFAPAQSAQENKTERAIFASGCFWGTEYHLQKVPGVISTKVGYTGGRVDNPTYKQVCTDKTGHAEAVEVIYDPSKTSYEKLARLFFETHDFTQLNRQGPDIGTQYRSGVFYLDEGQKDVAVKLIETLKQKGFDVKTEVTQAEKFWPAENYHQDYYKNNGQTPYCHIYRKIF